MKKLFPYIVFASLTRFSAISGLPVMANGCSSYENKNVEMNCAEDDTECQAQKAENFKPFKSVRS